MRFNAYLLPLFSKRIRKNGKVRSSKKLFSYTKSQSADGVLRRREARQKILPKDRRFEPSARAAYYTILSVIWESLCCAPAFCKV